MKRLQFTTVTKPLETYDSLLKYLTENLSVIIIENWNVNIHYNAFGGYYNLSISVTHESEHIEKNMITTIERRFKEWKEIENNKHLANFKCQ